MNFTTVHRPFKWRRRATTRNPSSKLYDRSRRKVGFDPSLFRHPTLPLFFLVPCYMPVHTYSNFRFSTCKRGCFGFCAPRSRQRTVKWLCSSGPSIQEKSEHFSENYLLSRLGWDGSLCRWFLRNMRRKNSCFTKGTKRSDG